MPTMMIAKVTSVLSPVPSFYIREDWQQGGRDNVWRLKLLAPPGPAESGVLDFIGQRLIPADTARMLTGTAYNLSTEILRICQDEAPPIGYADGDYGGNHRIGAYATVRDYDLDILINGVPFTGTPNIFYAGVGLLTFVERYNIMDPAGLVTGSPLRAAVRIERSFDGGGFCSWDYTLTALRPAPLAWLGGMQALKPYLKAGQTLHLIVPGCNLAAGIDITSEATERYLAPADWDDPLVAPHHFIQEIRQAGVPQWAWAMSYELGQSRDLPDFAGYRSVPMKFYPRWSGPRLMQPGETIRMRGRFGCYSRLN